MTSPIPTLERRAPAEPAPSAQERARFRRQLLTSAVLVLLGAVAAVGPALADAWRAGSSGPSAPGPGTVDAYRGLAVWVDVHDYARSYQRPGEDPAISPAELVGRVPAGTETLFLQTSGSGPRSRSDIVDPTAAAAFLREAHAAGMSVVGWYLPSYVDQRADLRRLLAIASFEADGHRFDGIAVDIEAGQGVRDHGERTRRLLRLSSALRRALGPRPVGAIVPPAALLEQVNPSYWPGFPWRDLARLYDVWLPMAYWTVRAPSSDLRDAFRLTTDAVERQRALLGRDDIPVHVIGGVADGIVAADVERFAAAVRESAPIGASVYDLRSTSPAIRSALSRALAGMTWGREGLVE